MVSCLLIPFFHTDTESFSLLLPFWQNSFVGIVAELKITILNCSCKSGVGLIDLPMEISPGFSNPICVDTQIGM